MKLIVIGKTKFKFLLDGENEYEKRLKHYCKFSEQIIPDIKNDGKLSIKELKEKEGRLILKSLKNNDYVILLDDKGLTLSSIEFSNFLNKKMVSSINELVFIIGGAFGLASSPCITPVLATLLAWVSQAKNPLISIICLFFFGLGQVIPLILAGATTENLKQFLELRKYSQIIPTLSGIFLVSIGILNLVANWI